MATSIIYTYVATMTEVGSAFTYTYSLVDNIASYADMYSYYIIYFGEMFCHNTSDCLSSYSPLHNKLHFRFLACFICIVMHLFS